MTQPGTSPLPEPKKAASDTLSQLLARILNQLAISAWLPSAALVLLTAFVMKLGLAADQARDSPPETQSETSTLGLVTSALQAMGNSSAATIVLMVAATVVLTMLTQAFTFEAIRVLEGYWGVGWTANQAARIGCGYHRWRRRQLSNRLKKVRKRAWKGARKAIRREQRDPEVTPRITSAAVNALGASVLNRRYLGSLSQGESELVQSFPWRDYTDAELLRRMENLEKRLLDYPQPQSILPTRLGNVLRHFEDETGAESVESLVEDVFDKLPFSLQLAHDEQRGQLDLYCSMVFVWLVVGAIAVIRFGWDQERVLCYWAIAVALVGAWYTYRAAVAAARYYGSLLIQISRYGDVQAGQQQSATSVWSNLLDRFRRRANR